MKCNMHIGNKPYGNKVTIRRKFVPIKFSITGENQFVNAAVKLPFTTNKVIGLLTTSSLVNPCIDEGLPP